MYLTQAPVHETEKYACDAKNLRVNAIYLQKNILMRKQYLILLALAFPFAASAQVTNAENYVPGDQIHNQNCSMPSPGGSGTSQTWDFSTVVDDTVANTIWVFDDTASGDPNDIILSAISQGPAGTPIHKTATQNLLLGYSLGIYNLTYTPGLLQAERSFNYATTDNLAYTVAGTLNGGGNVDVKVDGSGTLKTPVGNYPNAYRMVMVRDEYDSLLFITTSYLTTHNVSYIWYDAAHTAPLFRIDSTYMEGTGSLAILNDTSGTAEYQREFFPAAVHGITIPEAAGSANLHGNTLTLNAGLQDGQRYKLAIYNISGQIVYNSVFTAAGNVNRLDLEKELTAGTYFVRVSQKNSHATPMIIKTVKD
jgi:hypothetical protein